MKDSKFAIVSRQSSLWGSLIGTTIAMIISCYSFVRASVTGEGFTLEYQIILSVGCFIIAFRFFVRALFTTQSSVKILVLKGLNQWQLYILFQSQFALVLLCAVTIVVLRAYGFTFTGSIFLIQALVVVLLWFVTFNAIFTNKIKGFKRDKTFLAKYILTILLDLCMIPLSFVIIINSTLSDESEILTVATGIGIFVLLTLIELALHSHDNIVYTRASRTSSKSSHAAGGQI